MYRGDTINFINVLLSFNSSIHNAFTSYGRNFDHVKMQVSVLVSILTLTSILIGLQYKFKGYIEI
jgi:hypothetical protein